MEQIQKRVRMRGVNVGAKPLRGTRELVQPSLIQISICIDLQVTVCCLWYIKEAPRIELGVSWYVRNYSNFFLNMKNHL